MTPSFAEAMRQIEQRGWVLIADVSPEEQRELRQRFREAQRDAGWRIRTLYRERESALSVARSTPIEVGGSHDTRNQSRDL